MLLLLICWIIAGITAEDPPKMHYELKNSSICLQVVKPPPFEQDTWLFYKEGIVVNKKITSKFADKVDYNPENQSLCINKLTETDSGIYTFKFFDANFTESTETYKLVVQDAVPKPVIRMSGLHSNLSVGLCNITVNCSIQDEWVLSLCDEVRCRTSQRSLHRTVNITIFTDNRSVVCRGNNAVSTSNDTKSVEAACFRISNPEQEKTPEPQTLLVILIGVAVFVSLCVVLCVAKWLLSAEDNHQQAPAAQIIQSQPAEAQPDSLQRISTSSSSQAEASYENVDATPPCQTSSPTISARVEFGPKQKVDTVYSVLQAPKVTSSVGKSDSSKGHNKVQEALTTQYASLDGAEHPVQIDTVYSVLQKPKNLESQHQ